MGMLFTVKLPDPWHEITVAITMALYLGSGVVFHWARVEAWSLHRPDPEEPPKLWK
jgi:hypothetical protein